MDLCRKKWKMPYVKFLLKMCIRDRISIYDVYDAIIQNSIVDVSHFNTSNATSLEKSVYQTFSRTKKSAINRIKKELRVNNKKNGKQLSETTDGYLDYIFSKIGRAHV